MPERSRAQLSDAVKELTRAAGPTVLIVEPNPDRQWRMARLITLLGHRVIGSGTLEGACALLAACPVHMVLVAEELCPNGVRNTVADLKALQPESRVTVVRAPEEASGVHPARLDFIDYVQQPVSSEDLRRLLVRLV